MNSSLLGTESSSASVGQFSKKQVDLLVDFDLRQRVCFAVQSHEQTAV